MDFAPKKQEKVEITKKKTTIRRKMTKDDAFDEE